MPKIKIFSKELEHLDVLEYHVNKFLEKEGIEFIDMKMNVSKDKYGADLLIVSLIYEDLDNSDFDEDVEIEEEEEQI
jgi:hypothetical protein